MGGVDWGRVVVLCLVVASALSPGLVVGEEGVEAVDDGTVVDENRTTAAIDGGADTANETTETVSRTTEEAGGTVDETTGDTSVDTETDATIRSRESADGSSSDGTDSSSDGTDSSSDGTDSSSDGTGVDGSVGATADGTGEASGSVEGRTRGLADVSDATRETIDTSNDAFAGAMEDATGRLTGSGSASDRAVGTWLTTPTESHPESRFAANDAATDDETAADADGHDDRAAVAPIDHRPGLRTTSEAGGATVAAGLGAIAAGMLAGQPGIGAAAWAVGQTGTNALERLLRAIAPFRYSRYDGSDPLEHDARAAVYDEIQAQPGTHLSEAAESADVNLSTARHHLKVLEREGLVETAKMRGRKRLFPAYADGKELAAALADSSTADVLATLAGLGPSSASSIADELDLSVSTVSHHLSRLDEDGLVEREREGQAVINRLPPEVADAFADDGIATDEEPTPVRAD